MDFIGVLMVIGIIGYLFGGKSREPAKPPPKPYVPKTGFRLETAFLSRFREWRANFNPKLPSLSWLSGVGRWLASVRDRIKTAIVKWWDKK